MATPQQGNRNRRDRQDKPKDDSGLTEKVVFINRCAKVVKGGRRFSFSALIVTGDKMGKVGCGFGKANEVSEAIRKASESAKRAMADAIADLGRYPDSNGFELKAAISRKIHVPSDWLTLGNGSNDILELTTRAVAQGGDEVIFSKHAFAVYPLATQAVGAQAVEINAKPIDLGHDLTGMLAAITSKTKLIFVANPNNPTGSFLTGQEIADFLGAVPQHIVVVLDEAYNEYLPAEQQYDAIAMVRQYPHLLVSRSFSKAYGLAGLRLGYSVAQPELTDLLNRIRQPFNVNTLAQAAAIAALFDQEFLDQGATLNRQGCGFPLDCLQKTRHF